jgi:hypothetical protein
MADGDRCNIVLDFRWGGRTRKFKSFKRIHPEIISDGERKRLYAIAKNAGYSDEQFKQVISACGYASSTEVKRKHYEVIRDCIEGSPIEQLPRTLEYLGKWCQENQ